MSFQLSSESDKNKIFLLHLNELEGRLDPFCYIPEIVALDRMIKSKTSYCLRDFSTFRASGATPSKTHEEYYSNEENGIPFIRVQNLSVTGELNQCDLVYISKEVHQGQLKRSQIKEHDLLVKITGVGRMGIASVVPKGFIGNINQHIVVVRTGSREISENIAAYLNLDSVEKVASKRATGGTRPALDYTALFSMPIISDRVVYTKIQKAVASKKQKEADAKVLLDSIDEYLLGELGIDLSDQKENIIQSRIFTRRLSELVGDRLDPDYFQKYYDELIASLGKGLFSCAAIKDVTLLVSSGNTPARSDYSGVPTEYPIIKVASYSEDFICLGKVGYTNASKQLRAKENDIFILSAAHQASYVGRFLKFLNCPPIEYTSYVGELICIRADKACCNPMFLFSLLNTELYKTLLNREKRGQTSHIYAKNIKHISIPVPPLSKQTEIADCITEIRNQVKQLKQEAKEGLEHAKKEVEWMLLDTKKR